MSSLAEGPAMRVVFGYSERKFVKPYFPFNFRDISPNEAGGVFTPPVNHARPTDPFTIHVKSDRSGILLTPFQVEDNFPERTAHVCGGVIIAFGTKDRLVIVSGEYPLLGQDNFHLGVAPTQYLLKTDYNDFDVVVEPIQEQHNNHPYVLENDRNGRPGLSLEGRNGLEVIDYQGQVLVRRM